MALAHLGHRVEHSRLCQLLEEQSRRMLVVQLWGGMAKLSSLAGIKNTNKKKQKKFQEAGEFRERTRQYTEKGNAEKMRGWRK